MPTPFLRRLIALGLALGPVRPVAAQAPMTPTIHLGAATAQGDFRAEIHARVGLEAGLSLSVPLSRRLSVRPRLMYTLFPVEASDFTYRSTRYFDHGFENAKWSSWAFGADGLFRPAGEGGRLYFVSGLFYKAWHLKSYGSYTTQDRLNGTRTFTVDDAATSNEPALDLGLGWTLRRHLSLETRMTLSSYRKLSYNTLQMGVAAHF